MTRPIEPDHAMILSGGGAYGSYEVGVMAALFTGESPATDNRLVNPGVYSGTSVGALNASIMVSYPEADVCDLVRYLADVWRERISDNPRNCGNGIFRFRADPFRYLEPQCFMGNPARPVAETYGDAAFFARDWFYRGLNFFMTAGSLQERTLQLVDFSTLISSEPLRQLLRDVISLEGIRRSQTRLRVVATNWDTGDVMTFENSDMTDEFGYEAIRGSTALPGIFPPAEVAGQLYVDGGLVMNTPLYSAIRAGGTTLYVVYMDPDPQNIPLRKLQSTIDTLDRVFVINFAAKMNEDIKTARWINDGLEVIERAGRGEALSGAHATSFARVAAQIETRLKEGVPYKKLTIHRFHPRDDLGGGTLGLLNFDRDRMMALIDRGFSDALNHDCVESRCVIPK